MTFLWVVAIALVGGLAGALQSQSLGLMEQRVGTLASTFVTYAGGGLLIAVLMVTFQSGRIPELKELPWWVFTAGPMGLVVVAALGASVARFGLGAGLTLVTGSILVMGAVVEHFGWFGVGNHIDAARLLGIGLVILGTWLVLRT